MHLFVGTSGYSYKEWKGSFYPEKFPPKKMLGYYAERLSTVEINATFRRMPTAKLLASWREQTPASFRFALKAPQAITHFKRLKDVESETEFFLRTAATMGEQLAAVLFQMPPNLKKDIPRLEAFLPLLAQAKDVRAAFEFRHESWFEDDELASLLRRHSCALCVAETEGEGPPEQISTTDWGYLRLRGDGYTEKRLKEWVAKVRAQKWSDAYVFFRHEETGTGPKFAAQFLELSGS